MEDQENHNIKRNMSDRGEPVLMGVEKSDPSSYIYIDKNEFKIGRAKANDEIIAHVSISRQHCIFKHVGDKEWTIQNFSSGGTFVNQIALTSGERRTLRAGDVVQFGPLAEFAYKFVFLSKNEPVAKRRRLSTPELELENIVMKQKTFEESQQMERDHLAEQMKAKHIEQLELKNELTKLLKDRETVLGEKDDLNKQINTLEKSIEDVKVAEINLEKLNRELSERLDKERQEFEARLSEEKKKMEEALEMSKKEKEMLEKNMREQLEKLKEEQQIEHKKLTESLTEEKKTAEKLQGENTEFAQKLKEMENALVNMEAKANQLQTTLEERQALKAPEVVSLGTIAENVEIVDDSNVMILETIDLTVETPADKKVAETTSTGSVNEVFNKVGDIMDEQLTCSICSELFVTATTLNCTHTFCQYCINTWNKKKAECPVCRASITAMNRSLVLDNFIDKMIENLSAEYKKRRTDIVEERRESERLAKQATASGTGRRGRNRGRNANANVNATINLTGNAPAAATSAANNTRASARTERTDGIQHRRPQARVNPIWNNPSSSHSHPHQQPISIGSTSNNQQTSASGGSTGYSTNQTNDESDSSSGSTSTVSSITDHDGDTASLAPSSSNSQTSEDPENNFPDMDTSIDSEGHSIDHNWGLDEGEDDFFWWSEQSDDDSMDGLPGALYGGYGACYACGRRGHWAPGCPFR